MLIGHVVYADTEHGSTYAQGWWLIFLPETPKALKRIPDDEIRVLVDKHFESQRDDAEARALTAAQAVFHQATSVTPGEWGYDVWD